MSNCVQCGIEIPDGQRTCSMCYGDIDHGSDGYYRQWMEEQYHAEQIRQEQERLEQQQQITDSP